jgi:hypothetical protein
MLIQRLSDSLACWVRGRRDGERKGVGGGRRLSISYNNNCQFQHTTHSTHTHSIAQHSYISPIQNHSIHTHTLNTHTTPTHHTHTLTPHLHSIHTRTPSPSHNTQHPHITHTHSFHTFTVYTHTTPTQNTQQCTALTPVSPHPAHIVWGKTQKVNRITALNHHLIYGYCSRFRYIVAELYCCIISLLFLLGSVQLSSDVVVCSVIFNFVIFYSILF